MPSRNPSRPCRVHSSVVKRPCRRFFGASGLPSRSAYPLPYLPFSSLLFACWPPSYTQPIDCANRDSETLLKPLQTLASIGVSQPHDGNTKTADATATATPRHSHTQGRHGHDGHDVQDTTQPQPRRGHDRIQRNVPARYHTTRQNAIIQTFQCCTMQQTTPVGECPPGAKSKAAGSLV